MRKIYFGMAVVWTVIIIVGCLVSMQTLKNDKVNLMDNDKTFHSLFYLFFMILWCAALNVKSFKNCLLVFGSAVVVGIIIEILQGLVTIDRSPDVEDVVSNTLGAFAGLLVVLIFRFLKQRISYSPGV